jgi:hypothetical protein
MPKSGKDNFQKKRPSANEGPGFTFQRLIWFSGYKILNVGFKRASEKFKTGSILYHQKALHKL